MKFYLIKTNFESFKFAFKWNFGLTIQVLRFCVAEDLTSHLYEQIGDERKQGKKAFGSF